MRKLFALFILLLAGFQSVNAQVATCNADFTTTYSPNTPNTIRFIPAFYGDSVNTSHFWLFGDGSSGTEPNPIHTYQNPGTYTVMHIVTHVFGPNNICRDTSFHSIVIQSVCNLTPSFSFIVDTSNNPTPGRIVYFQNTSSPYNFSDSVRWTFGDGTSAGGQNVSHTYTASGNYNVCMRIIQRVNGALTNCVREVCQTVAIGTPCNLTPSFTVSTNASTTFTFTNTSAGLSNTDSIRWSFGDGTFANTVNAAHSYANPGTYVVCLRIIKRDATGTLTNCAREYCQTIQVQNPACNLVVGFNTTATSLANTIYFQNTSTPLSSADSIRWNFGDNTFSSDANPTHVYNNAGTYTVCLRIIKRDSTGNLTNCDRSWCRQVIVGSSPCNLQAYYTYTSGNALNTVIFQNNSGGTQTGDTVRWTFGDGTTGTGSIITHTFPQAGIYLVCLRVKRATPAGTAPCVSEYCDSIQIGVINPCTINPTFTATTVAGSTNTFLFTNTTAGLAATDSVKWFFGDGTTSTDLNPTHTYTQSGVYRACLVIKRPSVTAGTGPCIREYCQALTVAAPCNITPSYTYIADSSNAFRIIFQNQTVVPTTGIYYFWTFGDGTSGTGPNPVHLYRNPGDYVVCLRVQTSFNCTASICDTISVSAGGCYVNAEFGYSRMSASALSYQFRPRIIDSSWTYSWDFGDNSTSSVPAASHTYSQAGTYTVCLTVTRSPGCSAVFCRTVNVYPALNCDSIRVSYTYQRDPYMPNKLYFYTVANYPVLSQTWTITRINSATPLPTITLYRSNPVYYFQDTGYYRVCLRAYTMGGCVKDTCEIIYINQVVAPVNPCYLQAYPNPATSYINLSMSLNQPQTVYVQIFNSMNVLVKQRTFPGAAGGNTFSIYVGDLMPGTFNVRVVYGNSVCYSRFMKL